MNNGSAAAFDAAIIDDLKHGKKVESNGKFDGIVHTIVEASKKIGLEAENRELKEEIKSLKAERVEMANAVSSAVWEELMNRAKKYEDSDTHTSLPGFLFNDISDIVLNKILDYKAKKKVRRMTYLELDRWLTDGNGVYRCGKTVRKDISYDCEDRNNPVSTYYKICGFDEDTWHEPLIEA